MKKTLTAALILAANSAAAQNLPCASQDQMAQFLTGKGQALTLTTDPQYPQAGAQMQFFVNPVTKEWTLLAVGPEGACVVTFGVNWNLQSGAA